MTPRREQETAQRERSAREHGRSIPHYTAEVVKKLSQPPKSGKSTPPKRAAR